MISSLSAWQWRALDDLLRAFPGIQFVVTTHSPQVMSAAPRGSVRLIDRDHQVHRIEQIAGKDVNSILEDILDAPSRLKEILTRSFGSSAEPSWGGSRRL